MDLMNNIQTALIVDDNKQEIEGLENMLVAQNIYYTYYSPESLDAQEHVQLKNHQLIFIDFSLDDAAEDVNNIATIRRYLRKICYNNFGSYGLVVWTKHPEKIDALRNKLTNDAIDKAYITPLFIICLDKTNYLQNGYGSLFADLNRKLAQDKAAAFFFNWRASVEQGADKALNDVYSLMPDYTQQNTNFTYLLYQLADNFSGVPVKDGRKYEGMIHDACKAFNELLHSDLSTCQNDIIDIFTEEHIAKPHYENFADELLHIAKINSKILIDSTIQDPQIILPGRVYKIKNDISLLKVQSAPRNSTPIAIELTPPCDFAHKKISSRLIGGFIINCPLAEDKLYTYTHTTFKADSKYLIWPLYFENNIKFICLDFRNVLVINDEELRDTQKFDILFTVKSRLFADILQKFSSHAARLGLAIIQPHLQEPQKNEKD